LQEVRSIREATDWGYSPALGFRKPISEDTKGVVVMKRFSLLGAVAMSAAALLFAVGADANGPPTGKCNSAKIKCVTTKATALLACQNKAESKLLPLDPTCISKAETKFSSPADQKGCLDKAEKDLVKSPCSTTNNADDLEAKVDAFVLDAVQELDPGYPT